MKKLCSLIFLGIFCLTTPLISTEAPPAPMQSTETPPFRDRGDDEATSSQQKYKKIAAVVIGTLAAITIGLLVSGANTGKHAQPSSTPPPE